MKYTQVFQSLIFTLLLFVNSLSFSQGTALNFDGANDYVQTTYGGITGSADRSFEAWVYVNPSAPATNLCVLDYGVNAVGSRNTFFVSGSRGLSFISGGTNANIGSSANAVPVGQWAHVAFVLDNGTGFLYVNGFQVGTGSLTTVNTPAGNQDLTIGQRVTGGSILFDGSIDEVRVYDYARTGVQINADINAEYCMLPSGLTAYYRLNEGVPNATNTSQIYALDDSGNGNTGTLNNFTLSGTGSNWVVGPVLTPGFNGSYLSVYSCTDFTSSSGMVYSNSGTYYETLTNAAGCDSLLEIDLNIIPITGSITASACDTYTSPSGNYIYTGSGLYYDTLQTAQGCDSVISINLTINSYDGTSFISACDYYTTPDGNDTWIVSGIYPITYTNAAGCDSIITYDITIANATGSTISISECESYTTPSGNNTYTSSGTYIDIIPNAAGCDSTITITLTIENVNTDVTVSAFTLAADLSGGTYQWFTCNNGVVGAAIAGATGQIFTPTVTGEYAVEVTINGCSSMSDCYTIDLSSIKETSILSANIFPNPSNGTFTITLSEKQDVIISVIDIQGKTIFNRHIIKENSVIIDEKLPSGVYFVQLKSIDKTATYKVVVL